MTAMVEGGDATAQGGQAAGDVVITHKIGLHARPSVKLTKLAKRYGSDVRLRAGAANDWINAKSIVKVMALKVAVGERLFFEARGDDAGDAVGALIALVERNFDESDG